MNRAKIVRRGFGALCLGGAAVMLIVGDTKPASGSADAAFIYYWITCFVLAALAMGAAILDLGAVRREARAAQRALLQTTLHSIEDEKPRRASADIIHKKDELQH